MFSLMIVCTMLCLSFGDFIVLTWLYILNVDIEEAPMICNMSGTVALLGTSTILTFMVLFAVDRFSKIVMFKDIPMSYFRMVFLVLLTAILVVIGITFTTGTRSFTANINGVWCFPAYISSDIYTLIPGIISILWLGITISVVIVCYLAVWLWVRKVRRAVKGFAPSASIATEMNSSIANSSIPSSFSPGNQPQKHQEQSSVHDQSLSLQLHRSPPPFSSSSKKPTTTHSSTRQTDDKIEHEVFKMCYLLLTVLIFCWSPMFLCLLYKLICQQLAPLWAEEIALLFACLDFSLFTPTALIRFNKLYRKYWFMYVVPKSWQKNHVVEMIWGRGSMHDT